MSQEENDLATHVSLCHLRYQQLEGRLNAMEAKFIKMEADLSSLKVQLQSGFSEIKLLLEQRNNQRQTQYIATTGSIIVAIIACIGYILTR